MKKISEQGLLDVVADFDQLGGASLGLVAWEMFVSELEVSEAWASALSAGWLEPAGWDDVFGERLWRLSDDGWLARSARRGPPG